MTKVLVTGATGFVGYHITKQLAERGQQVRALVRRPERAKILAPFSVDLRTGDVTEPASVRAAMEGVETVFHTAAWVGFWRTGAGRMDAVNVEGTRLVLMAARDAGVKNFLHVSSVAAVGQSLDGKPADENNPWLEEWENVNYVRTKRRAEEIVLGFAKENPALSRTVGIHPVHGESVQAFGSEAQARRGEPDMHAGLEARHSLPMKVVAVNPTIILGAPDHHVSGGGRMVLNFLRGKVPGTIEWVASFVDVRDVAAASIAAIERGRNGERYILSAEAMPLPRFYGLVAEVARMKPPRFRLPRWFAYSFALLEEIRGAITRRSPAITREMLRHTTHPACYSSEKARRELGFSPRPLRETVADTVAWFLRERDSAGGRWQGTGHR